MDDVFQIFDEIDVLVENEKRPRVVRARRDYLSEFDEVDFRKRFGLCKEPVLYLLSLVEDQIKTRTNRNSAISPINRLLLTLRYYATGSFLVVVGDFLGVSEASASRIVGEVTEAIASLRPHFIKFSELEISADGFLEISRFPKVIGAIDCTHIPIKSPELMDLFVKKNAGQGKTVAEKIISNYDKNGDKSLSEDELRKGLKIVIKALNDLKTGFTNADKDGDQKLDINEVRQELQKVHGGYSLLQGVLSNYDMDNDGISQDELKKALDDADALLKGLQKEVDFTNADTNNDRKLDLDELKALLKK